MNKCKSDSPKIKLFALVRDGNGLPIFDDYNAIPPEIEHALNESDRNYIERMKKLCQ